MPKYSEHEKLRAVKDQSQAIGAYLEWLAEQGWELQRADEDGKTEYECRTIERRLAEYFEIDLRKIADEKDAMLEEQRRLNEC